MTRTLTIAAAAGALCVQYAGAEEAHPHRRIVNAPAAASVSGGPGGPPQSLAGHGIELGIGYTADILGNVSGGIAQAAHYAGLVEINVDVDLGKLAGWRGLAFHADVFQIHGTSISGESLGSLASASNIESGPSTRIFELWLEQKFFGDRLAVRFGQLAADAEFFVAEGGAHFINSTFGWPTISSDNIPSGGPIYPIAAPGVRISIEPDDGFKIMAGLWNGDPVGPCPEDRDPARCNEHGLDFRLGDPPLLLVEGSYSYGLSGGNLPGTIKVGGWHHYGEFDDLRRDDAGGLIGQTGGTPRRHDGNHGFYAIIEQMIHRLPDAGDAKGVSVFARVSGSPSDRNQIDFYADAGLVVSGAVPGRPNDVFGIAFAYSGISERASGFDRDSGLPVVRDNESVLELSYTAEIAPGWTLQPDFQFFWNPGGRVADESGMRPVGDAAVLGLRTGISY